MANREKKVPQLRFKGFTDVWEQRKLSEFGKATGGTSIESEFIDNGKYKVISIGSYSENSTYIDQDIKVNETEKTKTKVLNKDDLTMILNDKTSVGRIIGRVLLIDEDNTYVYNQRTERIEPYKHNYDSQFLYQLLNTNFIRSKIIRSAQGNTQIYVNWSNISQLEYLIPIKEEQTKIGRFFKQLDNTIALHQERLSKLQELKKSYISLMFPQKKENLPCLRFANFNDKWELRKLNEIANIIGGGTPNTKVPEYWKGDIDWYSPVEIGNEIYASGSRKKITELGLEKSSAKILPANKTILFTSRAGIGNMAILKKDGSTNQGFQSLVLNDGYDIYFIYSMRNKIKEYALRRASGSTFLEISGRELGKMELFIPSYKEQVQLGKLFKQIDNNITILQDKLDNLVILKKAYLQKMFI